MRCISTRSVVTVLTLAGLLGAVFAGAPAATSRPTTASTDAAAPATASAPATATVPATEPAGPPSELILRLEDAYWQRNPPARLEESCAVLLGLSCRNGNWGKEVWGHGLLYERHYRMGELLEANDTGNVLRLVVTIDVRYDPASKGETAKYVIDLRREGSYLTGAYAGTLKGRDLRGTAAGMLKPPPGRIDGHVPIAPLEHPRLLFRKADIPNLRKKAQTPEGKAIVERLKQSLHAASNSGPRGHYAAGHGFLYVLTGDGKHAQAAAQIAEGMEELGMEAFRGADAPDEQVSSALGLALAYDFCYEAWDQAFRCRIADRLDRAITALLRSSSNGSRTQHWSSWQGYARGVRGVLAMAIMDDLGTFGPKVPPPTMRTIDAPNDFQPGKGVPVMKFASEKVPTNWLIAGPFCRPSGAELGPAGEMGDIDFLESLGGPEKARPAEGTVVRYKGTTLEFRPMDLNAIAARKRKTPENTLYVAGLVGDTYNSVAYYYTVVQNDQPRFVRARHEATRASMTMWIAGRQVGRSDFIKLGAGRFPIMIRVALGEKTGPWDYSTIRPRFTELPEDQWKAEHQEAMDSWRSSYGGGREGPGRKLEGTPYKVTETEQAVRKYLALGVGDRGWGEEGDGPLGHAFADGVFPFMQSYRSVMGEDISPGSGAEWVLPLWTMRMVTHKGKPCQPTFGPSESQEIPCARVFPMGLSAVPREYLPGVLWAFNHTWGAEGDKSYAVTWPLEAVYLFLNYPLDVAPRNPAEVLPRAIQDRQKGYCVFRNRWQDEDDFVAAVLLNSQNLARSGTEAGAFRIWGLGERWAVQRRPGLRTSQNVVQGPTEEGWFEAQRAHFQAFPDGSGSVSMATRETYLAVIAYHKRPIGPPIAATRCFAADYSGASGAPGLFVVVDKRPAGKGTWVMSTSPGYKITTSDRGFTITAPSGATMVGTFISPAAVQVSVSPVDAAVQAVPSGEGDFFVVMTVQKGPPPEVKVEGQGLAAKVTVRPSSPQAVEGQTISFDGEKIILEKHR